MMRRLGIVLAAILAFLVVLLWALYPQMPDRLPVRGEIGTANLRIGDLERRFEVYVPPELADSAPLLFAIHGSGMDAASMRDLIGWRFASLADQEGFVVVYPEGFEREWNGCRAPGVTEADRRNLDDVGFVLALIDRFAIELRIDPRRVYAAGFSNGGSMAYRLATDAPERFAAVAAVVAQVPEPENSKCRQPSGQIPVLIMNGTSDPIVPWEGGIASLFGISARGRVMSTARSAEHWRRVNDISAGPEVTQLPDVDPEDGSRVVRSRWMGANTEVVLYAIHGGGHSIPGGPELGARWLTARFVGYTNRDIRGADHIWNFLKRHRR
jgi:polyhydroxybutyrate depolymerase